MKDILILTKVLLKNSLNSKSDKKNGVKTIFLLLSYVYIISIISFFSYNSIKVLLEIHQEAVFLNIILVAMLGLSLIQTIFTSLNILYFSKDIEFLLPLPISSKKIIIAKINCLLFSEYVFSILLILPAFIVYGILLKTSMAFYLIAILIILIFPIFPVSLIVLLINIVMNFTKIIKNKDMVQYITVILTILLVIGIQFLTGNNESVTNEQIAEMLLKANGLTTIFEKYFITLKPTITAILNYNNIIGLKNFTILFIETIVFYIIVLNISKSLYIKTATSVISGNTDYKKKVDYKKEFKIKKFGISYLKKEFINLFRNPIFFMQCVVPPVLFPIVFSIPLFTTLIKADSESAQQLINSYNNMNRTEVLIFSLAIIQFIFMLNYISVTAISRDGENAKFMKYIPIRLYKQCIYKILPSIILNMIPIIYIIIFALIFIPTIGILNIIGFGLTAILINILFSYLMILIDLKRPKLVWTSEYAVVKQNLNMLFQMIIGVLFISILFVFSYIIKDILNLLVILILINLVGILVLNSYMKKNENKLFKNIY